MTAMLAEIEGHRYDVSGTFRDVSQTSRRTVAAVRIVETWFNGRWGWNMRRLRLQVDDAGIWQLDVRWWRYERTLDYRTEADARAQLARWLVEAPGEWRRVDPRRRPPAV